MHCGKLLAKPYPAAAFLRVAGFLTAHTCVSASRPLVANVNYAASEVSGNATLAPVGRGYACVYPMTVADVVVDLFGVWTTAA
mgnify:CR=1 FL=1